jgi:alkylhydroperoxidase family enzyme
MTITGQTVDDALFDQLKAHFTEAQIIELTASIAMENFRSKFNVPLQVESQGLCVLPGPGK